MQRLEQPIGEILRKTKEMRLVADMCENNTKEMERVYATDQAIVSLISSIQELVNQIIILGYTPQEMMCFIRENIFARMQPDEIGIFYLAVSAHNELFNFKQQWKN